jgi:release factor glutamine methyltransferase
MTVSDTDLPHDGLTLVQAWTAARRRLEAAGIEGPVIDARLMLEVAANATRADIVTDPYRVLTPDQIQTLDSFLTRRAAREPVSHILGRKGFWTIELKVTPDVLTPRPDTEVIVDYVLKTLTPDLPVHMLDLGVGSGAILLAILSERVMATGLGVDISSPALEVARENAALMGLTDRAQFLHADWAQGQPDDRYDLVVSNPPYIATGVIATLEPEVREHEPRLALDGGKDGLDAYRKLASEILRVLKPGGLFAIEIGYDQSRPVEALMRHAGAKGVRTLKDLANRNRVVTGTKNLEKNLLGKAASIG